MKNTIKAVVIALSVAAGSATADGNQTTPFSYFAMYNPATERYDLCWHDAYGHGNCMDVGKVFELIRNQQNEDSKKELESSF